MPYVKGGNAAALPKFSDMLNISQSGGADYAHPLALPHLNFFLITPVSLTFRYPKTFPHSILHPRARIKICVHTSPCKRPSTLDAETQRGPEFLHVKSQCYLQKLPLFDS